MKATSAYLNQPTRSLTEVIAQRCANAYFAGGPCYATETYAREVEEHGLPPTLAARVVDHYRAIVSRKH